MKEERLKANYHTHTYRCHHAEGSDEQFVQAAIDAKLEILGFSDHMPIPDIRQYNRFCMVDRMSEDELPGYLDSLKSLKEKYSGQLEILSAFECEWLKENIDHLKKLSDLSDYLIFSNHERLIKGEEYDYTFYCDDDNLVRYCQEVKEALSSGLFTIFAHPEYFMTNRHSFNETCRWAADYLAKICVENDVIMEINLKGFEHRHRIDKILQPVYPIPQFWQIAAKHPIKVIYSCDAHSPLELFRAQRIKEVKDYLGDIDFEVIEYLKVKQG